MAEDESKRFAQNSISEEIYPNTARKSATEI
jgi:hypothetical protein